MPEKNDDKSGKPQPVDTKRVGLNNRIVTRSISEGYQREDKSSEPTGK